MYVKKDRYARESLEELREGSCQGLEVWGRLGFRVWSIRIGLWSLCLDSQFRLRSGHTLVLFRIGSDPFFLLLPYDEF